MTELSTKTDATVWQACLLAIVGGYCDAVGFLTFNAFAGAMTGNTVLLGIALAQDRLADAAQSAAIIASFMAGVAATALLRRFVPLAAILLVEMAAIGVAALVAPAAASLVLAFAMGLQSAGMTSFAGVSLSTVFQTGNLQKLVQFSLPPDGHEMPNAVGLTGRMWLAYLAGVVLGAAAWRWTPHPLPFAVLPLVPLLLRRAAWRTAD